MSEIGWIGRRDVVRLLGIGGAALAAGLPKRVHAAASGSTLVLGIDISDSITFDPAREAQYTAPLSLRAAYESLVTMSPGDYLEGQAGAREVMGAHGGRQGLAVLAAPDAKFNSGNPVTADDVKWTFDRLINIKDQPSQYVTNVASINVIDPKTVDIILKDPTQPILTILSGPNFGVMERKAVEAQGGTAAADANTTDKATQWLNQHSAGAGPFTMVGWTRGAQILLTRNEHYFRGPVHFEHVIVRHMGDSATQLLAIRRGDIGAAFNLIPEQIATLKGDKDVRVEGLKSLDYVYMALTNEPTFNKALAVKEARQAIACAIDYDGIINSLLGGKAMRCASFIPIGLFGSTEETTKKIRLASGPGSGEATAAESRLRGRVRIQADVRRCGGLRPDLCGAGAEDAVGPGTRRHQGRAGSGRSGEPAHAIHHRQNTRRRSDILESIRRRNRPMGAGQRQSRGQANPLDAGRLRSDRRLPRPLPNRIQPSGRRYTWSMRKCCSTRPAC